MLNLLREYGRKKNVLYRKDFTRRDLLLNAHGLTPLLLAILNPLQHHAYRFIVRIVGDQLAPERFCQDRLCQLINVRLRLAKSVLDAALPAKSSPADPLVTFSAARWCSVERGVDRTKVRTRKV